MRAPRSRNSEKARRVCRYLYSHYKNKEDLVRSIYESRVEAFDNFIDTRLKMPDIREAVPELPPTCSR